MLAFERGHGEDGRFWLLNKDGGVIFRRDLFNGASLEEYSGQIADDVVVLCGTSPGEPGLCDLHLGSGATRQDLDFPVGCLFPRRVSDGRISCIGLESGIFLLKIRSIDGHWNNFHKNGLGGERIIDILVRDVDNLILLKENQILVNWTPASTAPLSEGTVGWLLALGQDYLYSDCLRARPLAECQVKLGRLDGSQIVLWSAKKAIPFQAIRLGHHEAVLSIHIDGVIRHEIIRW